MTISTQQFIDAWTRLQNAHAVADLFGLSHDAVRSRASRLRQKGHALPRLRRGPVKPPAGEGVALRARRIRAGLSQAQLAERLGTSQSTVSRMERGSLELEAAGGWKAIVTACSVEAA